MAKPAKLKDIAKGIDRHLRRFEADPKINRPYGRGGLRPYYFPNAWDAGRYVGVRYVNFQGESFLSKTDAAAYLAWLNAGNVGTHYKMEREKGNPA